MNDKEKIKKAATFIDSFLVRTNTNLKKCASSKDLPEKESVIESFLVRTNTNLKKCASSKDLPEKESVIEILESQKRVLEKIKEILTSN